MIFILTGVCADLKSRGGCRAGSQHEKFMKEHCKKTCRLCDMMVIVTGGKTGNWDSLDSVELLNMNGSRSCSLPPLPKRSSMVSQSGLVACGVTVKYPKPFDGDYRSCYTLSSDWEKTHTLAKYRGGHSAWASPRGIMLIGGGHVSDMSNSDTTEILTKDGDTIPGFPLDYSTM